MSWWKYLFKTSLGQKKADWADFQKLQQQAEAADNARLAARGRISLVQNIDTDRKHWIVSCLVYVEGKDKKMELEYCPMFSNEFGQNGCCAKCEYAIKNREYHQLRQQAEQMKQRLDSFWKDKFAHVK